MVMDEDLTLGGGHTRSIYGWCIIELCTQNLYDLINQCHPNKFNLKKWIMYIQEEEVEYKIQNKKISETAF